MAIIRCNNNHYYDNTLNDSCPYCAELNSFQQEEPEDTFNEQLTSYYDSFDDEDVQLTQAYGEEVEEYEKTIGIFSDDLQHRYTAGWLVCTEGNDKGKSYTIYVARNYIGRDYDMDIVLESDKKIARSNHFSIVYEPKKNEFFCVAGTGYVYINGSAVTNQCILNDGDELNVGDSKYVFVKFCREGRVWSEKDS